MSSQSTMFRTSNPAFRDSVFQEARNDPEMTRSNVMTVQGAAFKSLILVGLLLAAAIWTWSQTLVGAPSLTAEGGQVAAQGAGAVIPASLVMYVLVGWIGGFIVALITTFVPRISPYTAPVYAVLSGLGLGGIS